MNRDTLKNIIKYLVILLGSIFILFIILSFFRIGLVFWFYEKIFNWVSMRLGFDYYLALFVSISTTILFWASFPYLAWTFLVNRKVYTSSIIMIVITGLMCLLIYTIGTDVKFSRIDGEPLKWYADTPAGRFESNSPGFDPKYGIRLNQYTNALALKEANDKLLKENEERKRIEKEAQEKELKESEERKRIEKETQEKELKESEERKRIEKETQEKELKESEERRRREKETQEKELKESEERRRREAYEAYLQKDERGNSTKDYLQLINAHVTGLRFFEGGINKPQQYQRNYKNIFVSDMTRYIYWELNLAFPQLYQQINFEINAVWHFPDNSIREQTANTYIKPNWYRSFHTIHTMGFGSEFQGRLMPGKYTVELFLQNTKIASGSFTVLR
jgi:hypothetical protein